MKIQTKQELANYCLRRLGDPVIQVNVSAEQISDRIDDAIAYWMMMHGESSHRGVFEHTITQDNIDNQYIDIPEGITQVYSIISGSENFFAGLLSPGNIMLEDFYFNNTRFQLYDYNILRTHMNLVEQQLGTTPMLEFNRVLGRVFIHGGWHKREVGDKIVFEVEKLLDESQVPDVFNDIWLKDYATALIKFQWSENLKKYQGMQLPGGITLNPDLISSEAREDMQRLREEMDNRYAQPLGFLMG